MKKDRSHHRASTKYLFVERIKNLEIVEKLASAKTEMQRKIYSVVQFNDLSIPLCCLAKERRNVFRW